VRHPPHAPWRNPLKTWHKVAIGVGVVGLVLVGTAGVAWARVKPRPLSAAIPTEDDAIAAALAQLGTEAPTGELAAAAYYMAYPDGSNPPVAGYAVAWDRIVRKLRSQLGRSEAGELAIPEAADVDDSSELVAAWLDSLTQTQRDGARAAIGPATWDKMAQAASRGDDRATKAALLSLKVGIERMRADDPLGALKLYSDLKSTLGPKLDEFTDILAQTVGTPEVT
jgi:hypothetical protein